MNKDWFPFFSMMFWLFTKLGGLAFAVTGVMALSTMTQMGFQFGFFLVAVLVPLGLAFVLLVTEIVFDLATAEMRRRNAVAK
jgi:hypothetical protein